MSRRREIPGTPPPRQEGISLIELLVAMLVGLILLGGLIQVYLSSKQSYNAQEQLARMQESGRFAMDMITRDLRRAGYWGGNVDLETIDSGAPGRVAAAHLCAADNTWGRMIGWRVSGIDDDDDGYEDCAADYLRGDILTIRHATLENVPTASLATNGLYLRSTMFAGRVMTGGLAADNDNQLPPPDPATAPQHLLPVDRQLITNSYYVGDSARACPGTNVPIPALWRIELNRTTGLPQAAEIAPGVEQFQVQYLLDGMYQDADPTWGDLEWRAVQAVRVWLLMRGECPEAGLANTTTYNMGNQPLIANDNFRRQLYVSTVMLRNTRVR